MEQRHRLTMGIPLLALTVWAITPVAALIGADPLRFEEASVKRTDRCTMQNSVDPGRIALNGDPLKLVLMEAFKLKTDQIIGPSWLDSDCFSVIAKMPDGATKEQLPAMLQALLAERFKLAAHKETRPHPGYALVVDKNGPKFRQSDPTSPVARPTGQVRFGFGSQTGGFKGSTTMAWLARYLSNRLDAPVEDLTGLKGNYDLDVSWVTDPTLEKVAPSAEVAATQLNPADAASLPSGAGNIFKTDGTSPPLGEGSV